MTQPLILLENVTRVYRLGQVEVHALRGVSLSVAEGELVSIMGPSGSGKSTLVNIIGCLDQPTSGRYLRDGLIEGDEPVLSPIRAEDVLATLPVPSAPVREVAR